MLYNILLILSFIYILSVLIMIPISAVTRLWNEDRQGAIMVTFIPPFNTLLILAVLLFAIPKEFIDNHKEKQIKSHKNDPRWNLMNIHISKQYKN